MPVIWGIKSIRQAMLWLIACALGAATASAGPWVKYDVGGDGNPANDYVVQPGAAGSWDNWTYYPSVIKDGSTYDMWYTGWDGSQTRIGMATSTNGTDWTKLGTASAGGGNDLVGYGSSVLKDGSTYKMWYGSNFDLAYATSTDGLNWTLASNVLTRGTGSDWDAQDASWSSVVEDGGAFKMWYGGQNAAGTYAIGYASSPDGVSWTKQGVVLQGGTSGTWDSVGVNDPSVVKIGDVWNMWFHGADASSAVRIGHATSTDGLNWTIDPNPVIDLGVAGAWDQNDAFSPSVLLEGNQLEMWYSGWNNDDPGRRIGLAIALVPEPGAALLLALGGALCAAQAGLRRWRRARGR